MCAEADDSLINGDLGSYFRTSYLYIVSICSSATYFCSQVLCDIEKIKYDSRTGDLITRPSLSAWEQNSRGESEKGVSASVLIHT